MPKETFFNLSEEKQEKIMRSAISEFTKHGFEKGNVGDIAKSAGVAKGSMYQYFEDKREIFLYSVRWGMELLVKKYDKYMAIGEDMDFFDFFYQNLKDIWVQMRGEREVVIFIQDVFLGKYKSLNDESMAYLMKVSDEYLLNMIRAGKKNGSIRKDIDDNIILIFITGASYKFKEYIMNKAREAGEDIVDEDYEKVKKESEAIIDLLKNGIGGK